MITNDVSTCPKCGGDLKYYDRVTRIVRTKGRKTWKIPMLLRPIRHTKEEFVEVLGYIDKYEHYCEKNPEYPNSRAGIAIENIREVYKVRLKKRDFLQDEDKKEVVGHRPFRENESLQRSGTVH